MKSQKTSHWTANLIRDESRYWLPSHGVSNDPYHDISSGAFVPSWNSSPNSLDPAHVRQLPGLDSFPSQSSSSSESLHNDGSAIIKIEAFQQIPNSSPIPSSPPVKSEPLDEHLVVSQSLALPIEVPLRATQATKEMRSMMHSLRLNPFTMHRLDKSDSGTPLTWTGEEAKPLEEEPLMFEWQIEGYHSGLEDDFELFVMPSDDEKPFPASEDSSEVHHSSMRSPSIQLLSSDSAKRSEIYLSSTRYGSESRSQAHRYHDAVDNESTDSGTSASWDGLDDPAAEEGYFLSGAWFPDAGQNSSTILSHQPQQPLPPEAYDHEAPFQPFYSEKRRSPISEHPSSKLHQVVSHPYRYCPSGDSSSRGLIRNLPRRQSSESLEVHDTPPYSNTDQLQKIPPCQSLMMYSPGHQSVYNKPDSAPSTDQSSQRIDSLIFPSGIQLSTPPLAPEAVARRQTTFPDPPSRLCDSTSSPSFQTIPNRGVPGRVSSLMPAGCSLYPEADSDSGSSHFRLHRIQPLPHLVGYPEPCTAPAPIAPPMNNASFKAHTNPTNGLPAYANPGSGASLRMYACADDLRRSLDMSYKDKHGMVQQAPSVPTVLSSTRVMAPTPLMPAQCTSTSGASILSSYYPSQITATQNHGVPHAYAGYTY
ncbi:hypothetical protein D9758_003582 [Tetrapyrgos nigripes]|uniref:Uncharacterized protein n=1 Tax=Tetrapyrgos nigripes TaxID=182062 RepID=A0A8H5LW45_9AGAR|nr:hypothetical protein D9758_003582 [Tetrapyrgos nigripes]